MTEEFALAPYTGDALGPTYNISIVRFQASSSILNPGTPFA